MMLFTSGIHKRSILFLNERVNQLFKAVDFDLEHLFQLPAQSPWRKAFLFEPNKIILR